MRLNLSANYTAGFAVALVIILVIRLISLSFNNSELFFDEAQYWYWSTDLTFGYFSKPPLLAWLIAGVSSVCGSQSEFCVRLAAPLTHCVTAILIFLSAKHLFDKRVAFWSGISFLLLPAVSLSSTIISTDVPLLLCWAAALFSYIRFSDNFDWRWAIAMGVAIGLGLNAKYAMAYFVGCAVIHALVCQQELTPARKPAFWAGVLVAAIMMVPNLLWNLQNDFITASHTGDNIGWSGLNLNWLGTLEFLGSQFGVFGPVLFGMFIATVFQMFRDSISPQHRLLISFSLPILLLITFQALMSKAYANWAATTYVAATILVVEVLVNRVPWGWMRTTNIIHGVTFAVLALAVCFAGPGQLLLPNGVQPFARTQGADLIAEAVEAELGKHEYNAVLTADRKISALMQYQLRDREEALLAWRWSETPRDHFELVVPFQASPRDPVLLVSHNEKVGRILEAFNSVEALGKRDIPAGETDEIYLFRLIGHRSFE